MWCAVAVPAPPFSSPADQPVVETCGSSRAAKILRNSFRMATRRVTDGSLPLPSNLASWHDALHHQRGCVHRFHSMACRFSPSSASRLQAVDAAAAGVKSGRVPVKASISPAPRPLGTCKATARQEGTTQQEPNTAVSSARTQLDLLEQLTSPKSDGIGLENGTPAEPRLRATIREQLSALVGNRVDDYTLPLGKRLKEGLKSLNALTVSQRRNIKRQALLTKVSGRNDSVFFATVGAFVLVPPFAILAIAILTGYVQLFP